ncbi:homoserine dehydrogenase [Terrimicrobium sacchariphilum]|uniref:Homoserine dehydrogenase n=1 Tax=Terrimicrobium sacchariphilum TaxID=690879 RepID=A0A146G9W8_TERSA|nr:homoserine dehydrogenase [Terrimicrobium sacchariphilum]GAT34231.1 homoserine dehydrogenase [Terrimicrobium sacchariphilum]
MEPIGIGLAGFGTVGAGVYKNLATNGDLISQRMGARFEVRKVAVRDLSKPRSVEAPEALFTTNLDELLSDPSIRIVVELMGGIEIPLEFVRKAIRAGKIVVTGNKALLAEHGQEIFHLAREHRVPVFYEAAVAGGIPIIKVVRESYVGNRFLSIHGILNGTSNYILTRMTDTGMDFAPALEEAKQLGYAEADPTLDINGWDAAHKALILASLAYGFWLDPDQIFVSGIDQVTAADIRFADELGYRLKLLATIQAGPENAIEVRVCPTLIPKSHVLASVNGVFNAVAVKGDIAGDSLFYGRGAGQDPTSSSVISDLAEAAAAIESPRFCYGFTSHDLYGKCQPVDESISRYYLRLAVNDRPGVLAAIAGALGEAGIGILSVIQPEGQEGDSVPLVLMIHDASYGAMRKAVERIAGLDCVRDQPVLLHVESFS